MCTIAFDFKTFVNVLVFLALFFIFFGWAYYSLKRRASFSLVFPLIIQAAFFLVGVIITTLGHDESEHLHCAWLMGQGMVPFRDFWQHHSPLLWMALAPCMKALKPSAMIFEISRLFSLGIFSLIVLLGWQLAKKAWGRKAHLPSYLLMVLSVGVYGEFFRIRPDLFTTLFLLAGVYASLGIAQGRKLSVFSAGVCVALAESFIFKQYLVALLPFIALFLFGRKTSLFRGVCAYAIGIAAGSMPLLLYLRKNNLISDFIYWVFVLNKERVHIGVILPLAISVLGVSGVWRLFRVYREEKNACALVLLWAFCLSTVSSFTGMVWASGSVSPRAGYYLQFWLMLCAVAASGGVLFEMVRKVTPLIKKAAVAAAILTLLIAPNLFNIMITRKEFFGEDKLAVAQLIAYSQNDTCAVLLPIHPIFCFDATRLYSYWQYIFCGVYSEVREDVHTKDITRALIARPPAVILARLDGREFMLDLFLRGLIKKQDYRPLRDLLDKEYTVKEIGETKYYIRNDRL